MEHGANSEISNFWLVFSECCNRQGLVSHFVPQIAICTTKTLAPKGIKSPKVVIRKQ